MAKASKKNAKSTKKTTGKAVDESSGEGVSVVQSENLTLITTGYRVRAKGEGAVATLPDEVTDFAHLKTRWEKALTKVKQTSYVLGAGKDGIFSEVFGASTDQLALRENTYAFSRGLGLIGFMEKWPQYEFPVNEEKLSEIVDDFDEKEWALFLNSAAENNDVFGPSLADVIKAAVNKQHRVIVAVVGGHGFIYPEMLEELSADPEVVKRLRFCGAKIDHYLPSELVGCAMPVDKARLDVCVPGVPAHGTRRLAALLQVVAPADKRGCSDPLADYDAIERAYKDGTRVNFESRTGSNTGKALSDERLIEEIKTAMKVVGPRPERIVRVLSQRGIRTRLPRVEELMTNIGE